MRAAIEVSSVPVIFSHSSCTAVNDHPRNVPDDVLAQLPGNGGVAMITFVPAFVSPKVAAWNERLETAMAEAGLEYRNLTLRGKFVKEWDGPPKPLATVEDVVAHVEHAREVAGIDHIGLGGDYDGVGSLPEGLEDTSKYPVLFAALLERGWSEDDCAKLAGQNTLRVLREVDGFAR
jgi:membrane dipeptidase